MNPQIEQLRKQFASYNLYEKKDFINNLQKKLEGQSSPEYSDFLNECIQIYQNQSGGGIAGGGDKPVEVVSLVCGILGVVLACFYGLGLPLAIIAIVFSRKKKDTHKTTAGLVLGIIGIVFSAITVALLIITVVAMVTMPDWMWMIY
ncbi:MAG: DUF4190 domain-containing protein [Defluviitaleaceae bacterium]|nr:DUF4190 domain-containing protein [Defluviitaleaceae bacterium]